MLSMRLVFLGRKIHPAKKHEIREMRRRHRIVSAPARNWGLSLFFSSGAEARLISGFVLLIRLVFFGRVNLPAKKHEIMEMQAEAPRRIYAGA